MDILDTTNIPGWPTGIQLGYSPIRKDLSPDLLSTSEREEWNAFTNETRKAEFLTARALFQAMREAAGLNDSYYLEKENLGKPFATNGSVRVHVSFSHSKVYVMCALSRQRDIGLDIEHRRRMVDKRLVKRILSEQEWHTHGEEDPIKLWTMKEAAVKCLGTGLRTNLKELELQNVDKNEFEVKINDEKSFQICSFVELDHQISIAY